MSKISQHFTNKDPVVEKIYERILAKADKLGNYRVDVKKTAIYLKSKYAFLGIYPKKTWLDIGFVFDHKKDDGYFRTIGQISKNRFNHQVRLESPDQVDDTFEKYLRESYSVRG